MSKENKIDKTNSIGELYIYKAEVIKIYDGDTFTVMVDHGFEVYTKRILRLARIDTPELRGEEREEGLRVRDLVRERIPLGSIIIIKTDKDTRGSYYRYIAEVYFEGVNINDWLLENGNARLYE